MPDPHPLEIFGVLEKGASHWYTLICILSSLSLCPFLAKQREIVWMHNKKTSLQQAWGGARKTIYEFVPPAAGGIPQGV